MSTDHDIVARLRMYANASIDGGWASVFRADLNIAANEIERLRVIVQGWEHSARNAERDMETLRAERDEARRMLCEEWAKQDGLPLDWQGRRGAEGMAEFVKWDCFKEDTND